MVVGIGTVSTTFKIPLSPLLVDQHTGVGYKTFALSGRITPGMRTQGVALGYGFHWAFSPPLLNLILEEVVL